MRGGWGQRIKGEREESWTGQYGGESSDDKGAGSLATCQALRKVLSAPQIPNPQNPTSLVLELPRFTAKTTYVHRG